MITNKEYKDHLRSIIVLFEGLYKPGHGDWIRQEVIYKLTEQVNAIPDETEGSNLMFEPPIEHSNLILEPAKSKGGPQRLPPKQQQDIDNAEKKKKFKAHKSNPIVGPGPRTEQQNRKLERYLKLLLDNSRYGMDGAITATTAEADRYKQYVGNMNLTNVKAITFSEWLEKDRADKPKGDPDIEADKGSKSTSDYGNTGWDE